MLTLTVCVALSGAGLAVALLTAWRRRFLAATRLAALSLLPIGLYMTGLVTLGSKIGGAVGTWSADLVFKPSVWTGFGVLAVAVVLYASSRFAAGRAGTRSERKAARAAGEGRSVAPVATVPALGTRTPAVQQPAGRSRTQPEPRPKAAKGKAADDGLSDFGDIEEILRKRGI